MKESRMADVSSSPYKILEGNLDTLLDPTKQQYGKPQTKVASPFTPRETKGIFSSIFSYASTFQKANQPRSF